MKIKIIEDSIKVVAIFFALAATFHIPIETFAQNKSPDSATFSTKKKKKRSDTTETSEADSVKLNKPATFLGSKQTLDSSAYRTISKRDILFDEYHTFFEILKHKTNAYPLYLGTPAQFNSLSFFGGMANDLGVSFNNAPLFDPCYGSFNIEQIAPEFMEKTEIFVGSDAAILFDNSGGAAINVQSPVYDVNYPYTRLWYSQGGNDHISSDGIFSQNFAPNLNFTFGFRRLSGRGRFLNSQSEAWNVRGALRWNVSERTNLSLTEVFTNHGYGAFGGIDADKSTDLQGETQIFDNDFAVPIFEDYKKRVLRHDISLNLSSYIAEDSSEVLQGALFFSNSDWKNRLSTDLLNYSADSSRNNSPGCRYFGLNLEYDNRLINAFRIKTGLNSYFVNLDQGTFNRKMETMSSSIFLRGELNITKKLSLSGGGRARIYDDELLVGGGGKLQYQFGESFTVFGDFSYFEQAPTPSESNINITKKIYLAIVETRLKSERARINFGGFYRDAKNPILGIEKSVGEQDSDTLFFIVGESERVFGAYLNFSVNVFKALTLEAFAQYRYSERDGERKELFPSIYGGVKTYYEFTRGASILRAGVSVEALSSFRGAKFIPQTRTYVSSDYEGTFMNDGVKVFVSARLGDAYVKLSFENALSQNLYYVPLYPVYERNFRLSFVWAFLN